MSELRRYSYLFETIYDRPDLSVFRAHDRTAAGYVTCDLAVPWTNFYSRDMRVIVVLESLLVAGFWPALVGVGARKGSCWYFTSSACSAELARSIQAHLDGLTSVRGDSWNFTREDRDGSMRALVKVFKLGPHRLSVATSSGFLLRHVVESGEFGVASTEPTQECYRSLADAEDSYVGVKDLEWQSHQAEGGEEA